MSFGYLPQPPIPSMLGIVKKSIFVSTRDLGCGKNSSFVMFSDFMLSETPDFKVEQ